MTESAATCAQWHSGPLQLWFLPHEKGRSGEAPARALLARWLGQPAQAVPLERDARERPRLTGVLAGHDVGWSHSGDALLVGTGAGVQLGVDLEHLRPRPHAMEVAARFFHPEETAALAALPGDQRQLQFVRLWCAKEAVLKAHGHGISFGLHKLRFESTADGVRLAQCDPRLGRAEDWCLWQGQPAPGYLAAAAWRPAP